MKLHDDIIRLNRDGWNRLAYSAWVNANGTPEQLARRLVNDPWRKMAPFRSFIDDLKGLRVANFLGSNGKMAVSMALLGAEVTVVDISEDNARYARELAAAAGVHIDYWVMDVMQFPVQEYAGAFDLVMMELGILHRIMDLRHFFGIVATVLKDSGRVVVRDYHPFNKKALQWKDGQMVAGGNYFDDSIHSGVVPYADLLNAEDRKTLTEIRTRPWTMGEIVTSAAGAGLTIRVLHEESGPIQRWVFLLLPIRRLRRNERLGSSILSA
jgi:2-polyprenyl-3-methyl-5-hydroxy-6-metoxy-1,4-benzoquinol methylase